MLFFFFSSLLRSFDVKFLTISISFSNSSENKLDTTSNLLKLIINLQAKFLIETSFLFPKINSKFPFVLWISGISDELFSKDSSL